MTTTMSKGNVMALAEKLNAGGSSNNVGGSTRPGTKGTIRRPTSGSSSVTDVPIPTTSLTGDNGEEGNDGKSQRRASTGIQPSGHDRKSASVGISSNSRSVAMVPSVDRPKNSLSKYGSGVRTSNISPVTPAIKPLKPPPKSTTSTMNKSFSKLNYVPPSEPKVVSMDSNTTQNGSMGKLESFLQDDKGNKKGFSVVSGHKSFSKSFGQLNYNDDETSVADDSTFVDNEDNDWWKASSGALPGSKNPSNPENKNDSALLNKESRPGDDESSISLDDERLIFESKASHTHTREQKSGQKQEKSKPNERQMGKYRKTVNSETEKMDEAKKDQKSPPNDTSEQLTLIPEHDHVERSVNDETIVNADLMKYNQTDASTDDDSECEKKSSKDKKSSTGGGKEKKKAVKGQKRISVKVTGGQLDLSAASSPEEAEKMKQAFEKWKAAQAAGPATTPKKLNSDDTGSGTSSSTRSRSRSRGPSSSSSVRDSRTSDNPRKSISNRTADNNDPDPANADSELEERLRSSRSSIRTPEESRSRGRSTGHRRPPSDPADHDNNQRHRDDTITSNSNDNRPSANKGRGRSVVRKRDGDGEDNKTPKKSESNSNSSDDYRRSKSVGARINPKKPQENTSKTSSGTAAPISPDGRQSERKSSTSNTGGASSSSSRQRSKSLGRSALRVGSGEDDDVSEKSPSKQPIAKARDEDATRRNPSTASNSPSSKPSDSKYRRSKSLGRSSQRAVDDDDTAAPVSSSSKSRIRSGNDSDDNAPQSRNGDNTKRDNSTVLKSQSSSSDESKYRRSRSLGRSSQHSESDGEHHIRENSTSKTRSTKSNDDDSARRNGCTQSSATSGNPKYKRSQSTGRRRSESDDEDHPRIPTVDILLERQNRRAEQSREHSSNESLGGSIIEVPNSIKGRPDRSERTEGFSRSKSVGRIRVTDKNADSTESVQKRSITSSDRSRRMTRSIKDSDDESNSNQRSPLTTAGRSSGTSSRSKSVGRPRRGTPEDRSKQLGNAIPWEGFLLQAQKSSRNVSTPQA